MQGNGKYLSGASWGVWVVRYVITAVSAAIIAFFVADYVVKANSTGFAAALTVITDSINNTSTANATALAGLQTSIDTLNATIELWSGGRND